MTKREIYFTILLLIIYLPLYEIWLYFYKKILFKFGIIVKFEPSSTLTVFSFSTNIFRTNKNIFFKIIINFLGDLFISLMFLIGVVFLFLLTFSISLHLVYIF